MNKRGYKLMVRGIDSATINRIVEQYVHSERDREIIKLSLLNDVSYTRIADRLDTWISPRTIQNILNKWMPVILEHLRK